MGSEAVNRDYILGMMRKMNYKTGPPLNFLDRQLDVQQGQPQGAQGGEDPRTNPFENLLGLRDFEKSAGPASPWDITKAEREAYFLMTGGGANDQPVTWMPGAQPDESYIENFVVGPNSFNYSDYTANLLLDQRTMLNHNKWVNDVGPWTSARLRTIDKLDVEPYIPTRGLYRAEPVPVYGNSPSIVEFGPEDLAMNRRRRW